MQEARIIYKDIKNIVLRVTPSLEVLLSVPKDTSQKEIEYVLQKRQKWIEERLERFGRNIQESKSLVSGEDIYYLGKRYRLKVIASNEEGVSLRGGFLEVRVRDREDFDSKEAMIKKWYQSRAKECFQKLLHHYIALLGCNPIQTLRIKEMKTRWGSCNPQKSSINLNLKLIEKDKRAIEYVILHELAHLKHFNHDKNFYAFVGLYMPDWRERKMRLLERL